MNAETQVLMLPSLEDAVHHAEVLAVYRASLDASTSPRQMPFFSKPIYQP